MSLTAEQRSLVNNLRVSIDTSPELEDYPPIIVHKQDLARLANFGMKHRLADSAITLRFALDCLEALDV